MTDMEKVITKLQDALEDAEDEGKIFAEVRRPVLFDALSLLKEQPEIIRCRDCKHWDEEYQQCTQLTMICNPNWFCADGEMRE